MKEVSDNWLLKGCVRQSFSDSYSKRKQAKDMWFHLPWYRRIVSWFCVVSDIDLRERSGEVAQTEENLLKMKEGSEELEISLCKKCADAAFLQLRELECEKDEIVAENCSSLSSGGSAVQRFLACQCAETLTLSRTEVGEHVLQAFQDYHP